MFTGHYRMFTFEMLDRLLRLALQGEYPYNPVCKVPGREYPSENICAFNIADALVATKKLLSTEVSPDPNDWKWGNMVIMKFDNTPWSYVPQVRPYINRYIVVPGNGNTNNIAEFNICGDFKNEYPELNWPHPKYVSGKTAAYTHILTFEEEFNYENNSYGIPGGLNEFPLQGNFDNMIE